MLTLISRISRLRNVVQKHSDNPYLRGRAAQVAGGALLADGLVGLENPLDGRQSRSGIFGNLFLVGFAVLWLWLTGTLMGGWGPYEDGTIAQGTIVSIDGRDPMRSDDSCGAVVQYMVGAQAYLADSVMSSSWICDAEVGETVEVSYLPSDPSEGRPVFESDNFIPKIFKGAGWLMLAFGIIGSLARLAEIGAGGWLILKGRKQVAAAEPADTTKLMEELQEAWGPERKPFFEKIPAGSGRGAGLPSFQQIFSQQTPPPPPQMPTGPPPGWYPDPSGGPMRRWWDGVRWTEHLQG